MKIKCGEMPVRVATKSVRSLPLLLYIKERLPYFAGWMTFTAAESLFLLEQGLDDILLGYPVYEEASKNNDDSFDDMERIIKGLLD